MKKMIINYVLTAVMDMLLQALRDMAGKTDNNVDDQLVETVAKNRTMIEAQIKARL